LLETMLMEIGSNDSAGLANGFEQLGGLAPAPRTHIQHTFPGLRLQQQPNQLRAFLLNRKRAFSVARQRARIARTSDAQAVWRKRRS
jgi:hypothetical protein